jgi:predicted DNA-binding transcriptional regulator AlpA
MSDKAAGILATVMLDPEDLAALMPTSGNDELLREVRDVLAQVRNRLDGGTEPLLVDEPAAGVLLGCSSRTVWEMAHKGELHPVWVGENSKRYSVAELREWIARQVKREQRPATLRRKAG